MRKALEDLNKEGGGSSTWSHDSRADSWGHTKSQLSQVAGKLSAVAERSHQQVGAVGGEGLEYVGWCESKHIIWYSWGGCASKSDNGELVMREYPGRSC